jgi:Nif-specific regulatory protein
MNVDQREFEALTKVAGINVAMHTGKDLEKAMDQIATTLISGLGVKGCSIKILNERHNVLEIVSIKGMTEDFVQMRRFRNDQQLYKPGSSAGRSGFVEDIDNTSKAIPEEVKDEGMKSVVSHPIKLDSQIIGVISIYDDKPHSFDENDKTFLDSITIHCAKPDQFLQNSQKN